MVGKGVEVTAKSVSGRQQVNKSSGRDVKLETACDALTYQKIISGKGKNHCICAMFH